MSVVRVGIIGQGRSGRNIHGQYLNTVPDRYKIALVCDELAERRARARQEYGCEVCASVGELLARGGLDLVVNATPSHRHVPVSLRCLEAGLNVLSEKPAARRAADIDRLAAAAQRAGRVYAVFQNWRYMPWFREAKRVVDSGVLGRPVLVKIRYNNFARRWDWQTVRGRHGGALLNTGPHPVDQALQFLGPGAAPRVVCVMDRALSYGDGEDHVKILLTAPGRPTLDVEISSCCAYPGPTIEVFATRGGLQAMRDRVQWKYYRPEDQPRQHLVETPFADAAGLPCYCREELAWHEEQCELKGADAFKTCVGQFYDMLHRTLTAGAPLEVTLEQVRAQIAVIEACHRQNPPARMPPADLP